MSEDRAFVKDFLYVEKLEKEVERLKSLLSETEGHLKQMIDINVINQSFDSGEDWRKRHKVEDGESFPHWYMRHHGIDLKYERDRVTKLTSLLSEIRGKVEGRKEEARNYLFEVADPIDEEDQRLIKHANADIDWCEWFLSLLPSVQE